MGLTGLSMELRGPRISSSVFRVVYTADHRLEDPGNPTGGNGFPALIVGSFPLLQQRLGQSLGRYSPVSLARFGGHFSALNPKP